MRYLIGPPAIATLLADSAPTEPVIHLMVPGLSHLNILAIAMLVNANHSVLSRISLAWLVATAHNQHGHASLPLQQGATVWCA